MAKNEMVATSNRNPIKKVFTNTKKPLSTSEKFQIKKLRRTTNDKIKNRPMKAFNKEKREGNNLYDIKKHD